MNRIINYSLFLLISIIIFSSCVVSKKQFDELLTEKVKMEADLNEMNDKISQLEADIESLNESLSTTTSNRDVLEKELKEKKIALSDLQAEHDKLQGYYDNAVNNSSRLNRDLADQHNHLMALQKTLDQSKNENNLLADSLQKREQKVAELEQVLAETQKAVHNLKKTVSDALTSFGSDELTVEERNGRIYVSLSEKLLFKSGSAAVDPKGQKALAQLADAIKDSDDIYILVEGHTDNVPISSTSKYMQDNWDLSVMRATSIVKILENNGVNSRNLTAAGRGEHFPVAMNDSKENKQLNRRTEIILTPDLSALFKVLSK
ncbi:MAG: OmpA family protein [Bacteroidota bacterium]